jgi:hypothetical protein
LGSAYTPGLQVSPFVKVHRLRRLPILGEALAGVGDPVKPNDIVARAALPGFMQTVKVSSQLSVEPADVPAMLQVKIGDKVERGQLLAVTKALFGLLKTEVKSPTEGTIETVSSITGNVGIRMQPTPVDLSAYLEGTVVEVLDKEGVVIEAHGALIQGIFGVGGERYGEIALVSKSPEEVLTAGQITDAHKGKIIVGGSNVTGEALRKAASVGVVGVIAGGVVDKELIEFLGYDIGVAITGQENITLSLMVTEGFGTIAMATRTFDLLAELNGKTASMNGATQIRAGVIRPEIIVPRPSSEGRAEAVQTQDTLEIGTSIRIIREPYFGKLASVTGLPSELVKVDSGTSVRVLTAVLKNGSEVTVPRANVEIIKSN